MRFVRTALAALIGGALAIVFVLVRRSSKETGKSIPAALTDVPGEAQRLASDVKSRATQAASTGWGTIREKEAAIKERIVAGKSVETAEVADEVADAPADAPAEVADTAETAEDA